MILTNFPRKPEQTEWNGKIYAETFMEGKQAYKDKWLIWAVPYEENTIERKAWLSRYSRQEEIDEK